MAKASTETPRASNWDYNNPYPLALLCLTCCVLVIYIHFWIFGGYQSTWTYWLAQAIPMFGVVVYGYRASLGFAVLRKQRQRHREMKATSGGFSDAKLASYDDLKKWGMAKGRPGVFLGLYEEKLGTPPISYDPFAPGESHMMTFAMNRGGKTSSLVIPTLLSSVGSSIVVTDVKAELAAVTISHRMNALGQRCLVIDPFGVSCVPAARLNLLDVLLDDLENNEGRNVDIYMQLIVKQLIPTALKPGSESNVEYFNTGGRNILCACMLFLLLRKPEELHFPGVADQVNGSVKDLEEIGFLLKSSEVLNPICKNYGEALLTYCNRDFFKTSGSMFDKAKNAVRIFLHEDMANASRTSDFRLQDILDERTTLYLSMGVPNMDYAGPWMGLIVSFAMEFLAQSRKKRKLLMLLDEAGTIGALPNLEKRLPQLPGNGLRVWFFFQNDTQLKHIYGSNVAQIILGNCSFWQGWGFRSKEITELFSFASGMLTHKAVSFSSDDDYQGFLTRNVSEVERPVVQNTDLLQPGPGVMFICIAGRPMIRGYLMPYYRDSYWRYVADLNPLEGPPPRDQPACYNVSRNFK